MTFAVIACGAAIDDGHKKAEGVARLVSVFCKAVWRYTYTFPAFVYVNWHLAKGRRCVLWIGRCAKAHPMAGFGMACFNIHHMID